MARKHQIAVGGGVLDSAYTGEIKLILRKHWDTSYEFKGGDRIAQRIVEKIQIQEAMEINTLGNTKRELWDLVEQYRSQMSNHHYRS